MTVPGVYSPSQGLEKERANLTPVFVLQILWIILTALCFFVFNNDLAGWASLIISNVWTAVAFVVQALRGH